MTKIIFLLLVLFIQYGCYAQFAPQAGLVGSTAIHKDSNVIVAWANNCTIQLGWMDIADTTLGKTSIGINMSAYGKADGDVISLGDEGEAIYFLENPIIDLQGPDFAIFENGFLNPIDSNGAYLELAKVSVSNDGMNWQTFKAICNNDTSIQIAGFGEYMDARHVHNFAGKYIGNYGTPFDLSELASTGGLDLNNIRYIKIKDVIGSINDSFCVRDNNMNKINDPYPTPFPSGGFDLDALGIIHQKFPTQVSTFTHTQLFNCYPNPSQGIFQINALSNIQSIQIFSMDGKTINYKMQDDKIDISAFSNGQYVVYIQLINGERSHQMITKYANN